MIHALVVLLGLVAFAKLLGYLPMPAMAALLLLAAWNMSEAPKSLHLFKTSQASDRWIFISCFLLTVLFDMVIAISTGIVLAAILFMKQIADMTRVMDITNNSQYISKPLADNIRVFKITGPVFFAAADKIFAELAQYTKDNRQIVLYFDNVSLLDAGGISALTKLINHCRKTKTELILTDVQFQVLRRLVKAGINAEEGVFRLYSRLVDVLS